MRLVIAAVGQRLARKGCMLLVVGCALGTGCCSREGASATKPAMAPNQSRGSEPAHESAPAPSPIKSIPEQAPDNAAHPSNKARYKAIHPLEAEFFALYPLEAQPSVPSWATGAEGLKGGTGPEKAARTRDDDLLTAFTCNGVGDAAGKRCAVSLHFPKAAELKMIRLFGSLGATLRERAQQSRVKGLKIHTGAGWITATIRDYWDFQYIVFDEGITTDAITIEVTDIFIGGKAKTVGITEIEVYGSRGAKRAALEVAPVATVVRGSPRFYNVITVDEYEAIDRFAATWIERVDGRAEPQRLFRGTALVGRNDERFALIASLKESGFRACCPWATTSYSILDKERRAILPARGLGKLTGELWQHATGNGFAVTPCIGCEESEAAFMQVIVEKDGLQSSNSGEEFFRDDKAVKAYAKQRDFELVYADRYRGPPCESVLRAEAFRMMPDKTLYPKSFFEHDPDDPPPEWFRCDLGNGAALLKVFWDCDMRGFLIDSAGKTLAPPLTGSGGQGLPVEELRWRKLPTGLWLIETDTGVGVLEKTKWTMRYPDASLGIVLPLGANFAGCTG